MHPTEPELFRLTYDSLSEFYRDMDDDSCWQKRSLFDFGVGDEPGYYRYPMSGMEDLVELLLTAQIEDDYYGAASVLLNEFADEALPLLEAALQNAARYPHAAQRLAAVGLNHAANRSEIVGKSAEQVQADFSRWQALTATICRNAKEEKTSWLSRLFQKSRKA